MYTLCIDDSFMMRGEYEKVFHRNGDARQRGVDLSCTPARMFDNPLKLEQGKPYDNDDRHNGHDGQFHRSGDSFVVVLYF